MNDSNSRPPIAADGFLNAICEFIIAECVKRMQQRPLRDTESARLNAVADVVANFTNRLTDIEKWGESHAKDIQAHAALFAKLAERMDGVEQKMEGVVPTAGSTLADAIRNDMDVGEALARFIDQSGARENIVREAVEGYVNNGSADGVLDDRIEDRINDLIDEADIEIGSVKVILRR